MSVGSSSCTIDLYPREMFPFFWYLYLAQLSHFKQLLKMSTKSNGHDIDPTIPSHLNSLTQLTFCHLTIFSLLSSSVPIDKVLTALNCSLKYTQISNRILSQLLFNWTRKSKDKLLPLNEISLLHSYLEHIIFLLGLYD